MRRERGIVAETVSGKARVVMDAAGHAACTACGLCRRSADGGTVSFETDALDELKPGDAVLVEIPGPGPASSAAILLLLPLVMFVCGVVVGEWLRKREVIASGSWVSVVIGFSLMCAAFLGAGVYDRFLRSSPRHRPRIVEILPPDQPCEDSCNASQAAEDSSTEKEP